MMLKVNYDGGVLQSYYFTQCQLISLQMKTALQRNKITTPDKILQNCNISLTLQ
jgi:hypothetical protein